MYVTLSSSSSGNFVSTANVDDGVWSNQGDAITALAKQNGFDAEADVSGAGLSVDHNVGSFGEARAWILGLAQWDYAAASVWRAAPAGQDVMIGTGQYVAVVASVGRSLTKATLLAHVPSGVDILSYAEQGDPTAPGLGPDPDTSRKYIAVIAHARDWSGSLAWSKSILWSNLYTLVSAWTAPPASSAPPSPPFPSPTTSGQSEWGAGPWILGGLALGGAAYALWRWRAQLRSTLVRA